MNSIKNIHILIKDESQNPNGTYKDRRSKYIIKKAIEKQVSKLCLITSGNAGYSLAMFARPQGIKVVCIIDTNLNQKIKTRLNKVCYKVIEQNLNKDILNPEKVIAMAREKDDEVIWEVTNGYSEAYEEIIGKLKNDKFDYLVCPVGSGEAFIGLCQGLKKYKHKAKLIGVGVKSNPSMADKLATPWSPYQSRIEAALKQGHKLIRLSEPEVAEIYQSYKDKYECEPSSSVVWAAFGKFNLVGKKVVVINSGKGLF